MSAASAFPAPAIPQPADRSPVVVQESVLIPGWINSLESYRQWAHSDDYPQTGWISYLNGQIWVDMEMEEFLTHNQVKLAYTGTLFMLLQSHPAGKDVPQFDILRHSPEGYASTDAVDGWFSSGVFGHSFQLVRQTDPLGHPLFVVNVK